MVSDGKVAFDCSMAARSVHSPGVAVMQTPSPVSASGASPVELTVNDCGVGVGVVVGKQVQVGEGVGVGVGVGVEVAWATGAAEELLAPPLMMTARSSRNAA